MKKSLLIIFLFFSTYSIFGQGNNFKSLIGKWAVSGEQHAGASLEVLDSARLVLTYMGEKRPILDYDIDFSKNPHWFDFTIQDTSGVIRVKSLIQFMNDSVVKWQLFLNDDRTSHFTASKGELLYLKRKRQDAEVLTSNQ